MGLKEKLLQFRGTQPAEIDWEAEKEKWLISVRGLFDRIHTWLGDLRDEKLLKITESEIMVVEEDIGRYTVPKLEIEFAGRCAVLEPVGTNMAHCDGRADFFLRGDLAKGYMLILYRYEGEDNWQVVHKIKRTQYTDLNRETVEGILEKWTDQQIVRKKPRML